MRKFFILMFGLLMLCACNPKTALDVEKEISRDLVTMADLHGEFIWYESTIVLDDYLSDSNGSVNNITNIFEVVDGMDVTTYSFYHTKSKSTVTEYDSFWVGDQQLYPEEIVLTFKQAFDRAMASNYIKPNSRYVTLRKQLGPNPINPQYIFGNKHAALFVDAITGEVRDTNPAFED